MAFKKEFKKDPMTLLPKEIVIYIKEHAEEISDSLERGDSEAIDLITPVVNEAVELEEFSNHYRKVYLLILSDFFARMSPEYAQHSGREPGEFSVKEAVHIVYLILRQNGIRATTTMSNEAVLVPRKDIESAGRIASSWIDCTVSKNPYWDPYIGFY